MKNKFQSKILLWVQAARPKTLPAAMGPVAVGSAVAYAVGKFSFWPALACFLCALVLQVAVNFANDYFDFKNKVDSEERLGPVRVTQSGLIPPGEVKRAMILSLFLAGLLFLYLVTVGGVVVVIIGGASILAALAYSGGPYPLASHGLGELFVFIFFGLVAVCSTYYIQAGELSSIAVFAALVPGVLITAIMVVNNLRDRETDSKAGKNTLAVIWGYKWTVRGYIFLVAVSYLIPVLMAFTTGSAAVCLPLLTLPFGMSLIRQIRTEQGRALNETLAKTAMLSLLHSLLFAIGIIFT